MGHGGSDSAIENGASQHIGDTQGIRWMFIDDGGFAQNDAIDIEIELNVF